MSGNSSTSSFNRRIKLYFRVLVIGFYGTFLLSAVLFYFKPQYFYWRSWEFFNEIVYNVPGCKLKWKKSEKGDQSRRYLFLNQNRWKTKVSCDEDGFRSVPFQADHYPILVVGDSHIWGSGLSDEETLPWKLAEILNIPVYNGGKGYKKLESLISKDSLDSTELIIEMTQASMLNKAHLRDAFEETFSPRPYLAYNTEAKMPFSQIFTPQRYFLPYKLFRSFSLESIQRTLKTLAMKFFAIPKIYDNRKTQQDLDYVVAAITKRSEEITSLGYNFVFIPIPMKFAITYEKITPETVWWERELIRRLRANNVHAIDLLSLFLEHRNEDLYFVTDSHWNDRGVELAVSKIIPYLEENSLIPSKE